MRYVGLAFLGMVLWTGQVSAAKYEDEQALKIISEGKIINTHNVNEQVLKLRVLYKGNYHICTDGAFSDTVFLQCWSYED